MKFMDIQIDMTRIHFTQNFLQIFAVVKLFIDLITCQVVTPQYENLQTMQFANLSGNYT